MRFSKKQPQRLLSTLSYALIAYLCTFLAVGPFVGNISAKIMPKNTEEEIGIITIEKGDTLWDLAIKYYQDPLLWKELTKYNNFTDPDLIYPGEEVQLPEQILLPTGTAKQIETEMILSMGATKADLDKVTERYDSAIAELQLATEDVKDVEKKLAKLSEENKALKTQLKQRENQILQLIKMREKEGTQGEEAQALIEELQNKLESQQTASQSTQDRISQLEESLAERSNQIEMREEELSQLSNDIKEHTDKLAQSQENIAKLHKKIDDAEVSYEKEAEKPDDVKESKLAVATAIAGGLILFALGVLAR